MPKFDIPNPLEIWKAIDPDAKRMFWRMVRHFLYISFISIWLMVLFAFFSGQITVHEALDLIFNRDHP